MPNLEQAMTALSNLKGVGTTMASGKSILKITVNLSTPRSKQSLRIEKLSLRDPVSEKRVRLERSIKKYFHFCSKSVENDICYLYFENFFSKKIFFLELFNS